MNDAEIVSPLRRENSSLSSESSQTFLKPRKIIILKMDYKIVK